MSMTLMTQLLKRSAKFAVVVLLVNGFFPSLTLAAEGGGNVPASWYLHVGPDLRLEVERLYKDILPVPSSQRLLPEGLYFTDQREARRRFDLTGLIDAVEIELPKDLGGGTAEVGIARRGYPKVKELWLIKPSKERFLLVRSDAQGTVPNRFMAKPKAFFMPVRDGAIAFNSDWNLFRIHRDKKYADNLSKVQFYPRVVPDTQVVKPVLAYHGRENKLLAATLPANAKSGGTATHVTVTLIDLKNDRSAIVMDPLKEPFHLSLKGVYAVDASTNMLVFHGFDWVQGKFAPAKPIIPYDVGRHKMIETADGEFILVQPNPKGEEIRYTLNSDGEISRLGGEKNVFTSFTQREEELISDVDKVDLVESLQLGQVDPMYGVPEIETFLSTSLSASKKTFSLLVYENGQMPEHVVNSFVWNMLTNDVPVSPALKDSEKIFSFEGDRILDGLDDGAAATVVSHLEEVARDHKVVLVLHNFPTGLAAEAENGNAVKHFTLFYKTFRDCINEGRCRVVMTMTKDVHTSLNQSLKDMFQIAQTKVLPQLSKSAQGEVVTRVQNELEQKHGKRLNGEAAKQFSLFVPNLGRKRLSPGNEVDALGRLFDYVIAERPDVAEIDQEILRDWLDRETGADRFKANLDLEKIRKEVKYKMVGHDEIIDKVIDRLRSLKNGTHFGNKPIGNFTLIGSTGVGKTYLAKLLGPALTGKKTIMIEMKNFNGFDTENPIYQELKASGDEVRVVCFDDINQASNDQQNHIANIIEEGMYAQGSKNQLSFRNTIVILTANWAQDIILSRPPGDIRQHIRRELTITKTGAKEPQVPAWFWGRIESGMFVMFPFAREQQMELAMKLAEEQINSFKERTGVEIVVHPDVLRPLVEYEEVAQAGARSIENRLASDIFTEVNKAIEDTTVRKVIVRQNDSGAVVAMGMTPKNSATFTKLWDEILDLNRQEKQVIDAYNAKKEDK